MSLKGRLARLERYKEPVDQMQRQAMIASIDQWLNELEAKAKTDREAQLYLDAIRDMLS